MENTTSIRVELGISAHKLIQQVMVNNKHIEAQITQGLELALDDVLNKDNFVEHIRQAAKREIEKTIQEGLASWEVRQRIKKMIETKLGEKLDAFAEKVANQLTENLQ